MAAIIDGMALFRDLPKKHLDAISAFTTVIDFAEGAPVILEGDPSTHHDLLLLLSGEVDVEARFSPLPTSMGFNLHAITNELFGEVSWLLGGKPTASVKCRKPCRFVRLDGVKLFDYCRANPDVGVEIMTRVAAVLARRVAHLTELMRDKELWHFAKPV
jgi:CRP-like cAMP-binding protein